MSLKLVVNNGPVRRKGRTTSATSTASERDTDLVRKEREQNNSRLLRELQLRKGKRDVPNSEYR